MYHRAGWWHRTAHCTNSLGEMYNRLNQPDRGLSLLEVARKIFDRLGLVAEMNTLEKIGMVHQRQGRYAQHRISFSRRLKVVPGTIALWGQSIATWGRFPMS